MCPGEQGCIGRCGDPTCCPCAACEASLFCHPIDMGGDGPDVCADPKNCRVKTVCGSGVTPYIASEFAGISTKARP